MVCTPAVPAVQRWQIPVIWGPSPCIEFQDSQGYIGRFSLKKKSNDKKWGWLVVTSVTPLIADSWDLACWVVSPSSISAPLLKLPPFWKRTNLLCSLIEPPNMLLGMLRGGSWLGHWSNAQGSSHSVYHLRDRGGISRP